MLIKNSDVDFLASIITKYGESDDPVACYELAIRLNKIHPIVDQLMAARRPLRGMQEYNIQRRKVAEKYAVSQREIPGGGIAYETNPARLAEMEADMASLSKAYADDINQEEERILKLGDVLDREVEISIDKIDYAWIKKVAKSRDLAFLLRHGLIDENTLPTRNSK